MLLLNSQAFPRKNIQRINFKIKPMPSNFTKNCALLVLILLYISISPFSFIHLDLARDFRVAFDIVNGINFPLNGQLFGGKFRLGPVWYYFLATLLWILNSWIGVITALTLISALQIPVAYILGKELENKWAGLFFSTLIMIPSWGSFDQLYPSHTMFSSLLAMSAIICAIRHEKTGKKKYIYIESILFSLALHAHPTAIISIIPAIYFNVKSVSKHGFDAKNFAICIFLLLTPFIPMLYFQAAQGFPMLEKISSYTLETAKSQDFSKIYTLPIDVLGGTFYISKLIEQGQAITWMYLLFIAAILINIFTKKLSSNNAEILSIDRGQLLIFALIIATSTVALMLLTQKHPYYYTSTLRCFILGAASIFIVKTTTKEKKYFFFLIFLITCFSNALFIKSAIKWSEEGVTPFNFFPLADVSSKKTSTIKLPATTSIQASHIQRWLCTAKYSSLHGPLGNHLIYSYAIEKKFQCPEKEIFIGKPLIEKKMTPGYIGIPEMISREIKNKSAIGVGSFKVYEIHNNIGTAFIENPAQGLYPPFEQNSLSHLQNIENIAPLKNNEILAVTNLSYEFLNPITITVEEGSTVIEPFYSDTQMRMYKCHHCDGRLFKMLFDARHKKIINAVVF